jgi:hypothetical protein
VRLRLLDGSHARSYVLKASDNRTLFAIGADGGLLESPMELKQIVTAPESVSRLSSIAAPASRSTQRRRRAEGKVSR